MRVVGLGGDESPEGAPDVVVAIDGPAGSGKSTVARRVAGLAGLRYLDTGATYRALTLALLRRGETLVHRVARLVRDTMPARFIVVIGARDAARVRASASSRPRMVGVLVGWPPRQPRRRAGSSCRRRSIPARIRGYSRQLSSISH